MTNKKKLIDLEESSLFRGSVFRFPARHPYEEFVDFMLFDTHSEQRRYGLMVTSGYKAGIMLVHLPADCESLDGGVDRNWVISNWKTWIYPECDVTDVLVFYGYDATAVN